MTPKLKPISEQTIVITGATSGIGLVTARMAARRGARLVLAARSEPALRQLDEELSAQGCRVISLVTDVCNMPQVRRVADEAVGHFGGFDTWVNNAGISIYGRTTEVPLDEQRRLFETNYWGVVNGSLVAAKHLRQRGGAIINIGSVLSDQAIPLQGPYVASKHAVKGFTDSLRMELEEEGAPISVTLIKPTSIDTPYRLHAKNYLSTEPKNLGPVYAPETVAEAILEAAEKPMRDVFVGAGAKLMSTLGKIAPRLMDRFLEKTISKVTHTDRPARHDLESLERPADHQLTERGGSPQHVAETSLYTRISTHPAVASAIALAAGLLVARLLGSSAGSEAVQAARHKLSRNFFEKLVNSLS